MRGTLTSLRRDPKPVVLWTPWGAIPRAGCVGPYAKGWTKLPNAIDPRPAVRAEKEGARKPS